MKILFVLGEYINETAQNGLCIKGIKENIEKYGHEVKIICIESENKLNNSDKNIRVINYHSITSKFKNRVRQIKKFFLMPLESTRLVKIIMKEIKKEIRLEKFDAIVAVQNPVEAPEAVYRIKRKNNNVKFIIYEIDPTSNRYKYPQNYIEKRWKKYCEKWERKIYSNADSVIHMETHRQHFSNKAYEDFIEKQYYLDIPNFEIFKNNNKNIIRDNITFLYAGAFYPKLRNPDYMIEIFKEISKRIIFKLKIFTGNSMMSYLKRIITGYESVISINSFIPQEILNGLVQNSDVLVSVGNKESDFLPSKIFYYMGNNKPIIHFFSDGKDVALTYLKKYPKALLINENDTIKKNVEMIIDFLDRVNKIEMDSEELLEIFEKNTPSYSAKKIMELV